LKTFIIDTNVILNNYKVPFELSKKSRVILHECVLQEIDKFKNKSGSVGYNSRKFSHSLNKILDPYKKQGYTYICKDYNLLIDHRDFDTDVNDEKIVLTSENCKRFKDKTILSNDINLLINAKLKNLEAETFNAHIKDDLYTGVRVVEMPEDQVNLLYENKLKLDGTFFENEIVVLKLNNQMIGVVRHINGKFINLECNEKGFLKCKTSGVYPRNKEQSWLLHLTKLLDEGKIDLITISGRAGCGKTLLAVSAAIDMLEKAGKGQLTLTKPVVSMGNQDLGFLPGTIEAKIQPIMKSYVQILDKLGHCEMDMFDDGNTKKISKIESNIKFDTLTHIRGQNIGDILIVDEAQSLTPHEIKSIVTRIDEGGKIILIADTDQIDTTSVNKYNCGFTYLVERFKDVSIAAHITLIKSERSRLADIAGEKL